MIGLNFRSTLMHTYYSLSRYQVMRYRNVIIFHFAGGLIFFPCFSDGAYVRRGSQLYYIYRFHRPFSYHFFFFSFCCCCCCCLHPSLQRPTILLDGISFINVIVMIWNKSLIQIHNAKAFIRIFFYRFRFISAVYLTFERKFVPAAGSAHVNGGVWTA